MQAYPLDGVRVIDFSWVVAGPYCTKLLALMGAEVIKIESATRPQYKQRGAWFSVLNNSKKSCTINLATEEGRGIVKKLIGLSDVVVENFSTGVMERLDLGYDRVRAIKPDLIYASSSGVGRTGPGKNWLAYGTLLQGLSGWTSLFTQPNPHMEGMGVLPSWTDPLTGLWEALLIQAALWHRARTGKGLYIDLSMLESTIVMMGDVFLRDAAGRSGNGPTPVPAARMAAPHGIFPCKDDDSWIAISVGPPSEWEALCAALDRPGWSTNPAWLTLSGRLPDREQIDRLLAGATRQQPVQPLFHRLQAAGVPAGICYSLAEIVGDPHMQSRGLFRHVRLADGTTQLTTGLPWKDDTGEKGKLGRPPALGEHNDYVFRELLGMSEQEYVRYQDQGVLV